MENNLIIVESATKIKTLRQFLGPKYIFESCFGHVRDLPQSSFGIDVENNFEPEYVPLPDRKTVIAKIKQAAKKCSTVYLCPDPDREGEAIAWHIKELLGPKVSVKRVSFNSITKEAVREAISHPTEINMALVNAQQARRLLDRLVGYTLSPLISRKLRRRGSESVSAGRVQSVALKLVVDREKAIEAFIPKEYWNITAHLWAQKETDSFIAYLFSVDGNKVDKEGEKNTIRIACEKDALSIKESLEQAAPYTVVRLERKEKRRNPEAPFITSTLQQEASRHFYFSPSKTMQIAQELYEGLDIGDTTEGLITYMRTDSVRIADEALSDLIHFIDTQYGKNLLPKEIRKFVVKKSAQDAHEAIRPTNVTRTPESIKKYLTEDQFSLYSLIWKRYVASQMAQAVYDTVSCDISDEKRFVLRATGSQLKEMGFLTLYEEGVDDATTDQENILLPDLEVGQKIQLDHIDALQAFTRPPPRYTEATLIKDLERSGIGRPSTYASIMKKILAREYTLKEQGRLKPTELGRIVTDILEQNFPDLMDINFTASMEDSLEAVAESKKEWKEILQNFWGPFEKSVEVAKTHARIPKIETDIPCPLCKSPLQKVWFQSKYFLGCSKYPECSYSASIEETEFNKEDYHPDFDFDQPCPKCGSPMKVRFGKYGAFLGCSNYPKCKGIVRILKKDESIEETHPCPAEGCDGMLTQKRSRYGKLFWSCSNYPDCDVIGSSVDMITEKFSGRAKTAYKKPEKSSQRVKKTASKKAEKPSKITSSPAKKKKEASSKSTTPRTKKKASSTS